MMKKKTKKSKYVDDGHTIYSMDALNDKKVKSGNQEGLYLTRKEKFAITMAAYKAYFLPLFIFIIGFTITLIILYFCLKA